MKLLTKTLAAASLAGAALAATPAAAQVSGNIAVANAPATIAFSNALNTAYQQINTTYAADITSLQQKSQQRQALVQPFDTDGDGQLNQTEMQAYQGTTQAQQVQTLDQELGQLSNRLDAARVYAVEQVLNQYGTALQSVITQNNIVAVLSPDSLVWSNQAANINQKVLDAMDAAPVAIQVTPPQGWQPSQQSVAAFQQVQQIRLIAAARQQQAQQQQAQQQPAQPSGR